MKNSLVPNRLPFTRGDRQYAAAFYRVLGIGISLIRGTLHPNLCFLSRAIGQSVLSNSADHVVSETQYEGQEFN